MRISDWSSDVCSSDLDGRVDARQAAEASHREIRHRDLLDVDVADILVAFAEQVLGAGFVVAERGGAVLRGAGNHEEGKAKRPGTVQQALALDNRRPVLADQTEKPVQPVQPLALPAKATINELVNAVQSANACGA